MVHRRPKLRKEKYWIGTILVTALLLAGWTAGLAFRAAEAVAATPGLQDTCARSSIGSLRDASDPAAQI